MRRSDFSDKLEEPYTASIGSNLEPNLNKSDEHFIPEEPTKKWIGAAAQNIQMTRGRPGKEFVDRLWQFLRRSDDLVDMRDTMQLIVDAISPFTRAAEFPNLSIFHDFALDNRTMQQATAPAASVPLLPVVRRDNATRVAEMITLAVKVWQLHRYGGHSIDSEL